MRHLGTSLLWALPYVAGIGIWVRCFVYIRKHSLSVGSYDQRAAMHFMAFPVACLVGMATTLGLSMASEHQAGELWLFLLLQLLSLLVHLYLAYVVVFYAAWVFVGVWRGGSHSDPVAALRSSYRSHQQQERGLRMCFIIVAAFLGLCTGLIMGMGLVAQKASRILMQLP